MVLYALDGRISLDNSLLSDGTLIIPGTLLAVDGTHLFEFIDHTIPVYSLSSTLQSNAITGTYITYTITLECTNSADPGNPLTVTAEIPAEFVFVGYTSDEGDFDDTTGIWTPTLENDFAYLNLILEPDSVATATQTVTLEWDGTHIHNDCVITDVDADGNLNYNDEVMTGYTTSLANLQHGMVYTVVKYCKVNDSAIVAPYDGIYNNRLCVINGSDVFVGDRVTTEDEYQKIVCTFIYNSAETVTIREYGNYESVSTTDVSRWAGLCINEGFNTTYSTSANLLTHPDALFDDTSSSDIVIGGGESSAEYVYTTNAFTEPSGIDPYFTGLVFKVNSFSNVNSGIELYLVSGTGEESETKTGYITRTGQYSMGDVADLWSLYDHDISNQTITVHLVFSNTTLSSQTFSYNNIVLSAYWQDDTTGGSYGFTAKNIHSSLYGVNVLSVDEGKAPIYDLNLLNMPGMDGELPISSDIKSKKKVVNFLLYGDSIEEAIDNLRYVSTWLSNERVSPNVPVTYSVVFDHDPTMNYEVILKDEIKVNQKANNLECELTWTIPDGVGRGTEPVVSGGIGSNPGMIKVYPLIEVISDGSGDIIITDNETGQILTLNETVAADTTLYFDCNDRTVIDSSDNDHTDNVDVDSTWISFYTDYHVTVTGGLLQQISYYPGY